MLSSEKEMQVYYVHGKEMKIFSDEVLVSPRDKSGLERPVLHRDDKWIIPTWNLKKEHRWQQMFIDDLRAREGGLQRGKGG